MIIREMTPADINFAYACTQAEGWKSETEEDFKGFLDYDPKGCFVAEDQSVRIGICIATAYRECGFIGELIIIKEKRGRGYGTRLFDFAVRYLSAKGIKNIYLEGDLAAVPIYEKAGFRKIVRSLRFVGKIRGQKYSNVRKVTPEDLATICIIDRELFGENRGYFLERRFSLYPDLCFVHERNNRINGYLMARPGFEVISVGPWAMLDSIDYGEALLAGLSLETGEQELRIGVFESNQSAAGIIKSMRTFAEKEYCWRMVLGPQENLGMDRHLFAIGSAAKG
ncbi:GNAT family N-acetyltransferase [candidate division KSB1 bacterium]|nr:GNAT family N-acetyltransferase [candidate division KSB1 bacterium]